MPKRDQGAHCLIWEKKWDPPPEYKSLEGNMTLSLFPAGSLVRALSLAESMHKNICQMNLADSSNFRFEQTDRFGKLEI